jgi:hypothetical protein
MNSVWISALILFAGLWTASPVKADLDRLVTADDLLKADRKTRNEFMKSVQQFVQEKNNLQKSKRLKYAESKKGRIVKNQNKEKHKTVSLSLSWFSTSHAQTVRTNSARQRAITQAFRIFNVQATSKNYCLYAGYPSTRNRNNNCVHPLASGSSDFQQNYLDIVVLFSKNPRTDYNNPNILFCNPYVFGLGDDSDLVDTRLRASDPSNNCYNLSTGPENMDRLFRLIEGSDRDQVISIKSAINGTLAAIQRSCLCYMYNDAGNLDTDESSNSLIKRAIEQADSGIKTCSYMLHQAEILLERIESSAMCSDDEFYYATQDNFLTLRDQISRSGFYLANPTEDRLSFTIIREEANLRAPLKRLCSETDYHSGTPKFDNDNPIVLRTPSGEFAIIDTLPDCTIEIEAMGNTRTSLSFTIEQARDIASRHLNEGPTGAYIACLRDRRALIEQLYTKYRDNMKAFEQEILKDQSKERKFEFMLGYSSGQFPPNKLERHRSYTDSQSQIYNQAIPGLKQEYKDIMRTLKLYNLHQDGMDYYQTKHKYPANHRSLIEPHEEALKTWYKDVADYRYNIGPNKIKNKIAEYILNQTKSEQLSIAINQFEAKLSNLTNKNLNPKEYMAIRDELFAAFKKEVGAYFIIDDDLTFESDLTMPPYFDVSSLPIGARDKGKVVEALTKMVASKLMMDHLKDYSKLEKDKLRDGRVTTDIMATLHDHPNIGYSGNYRIKLSDQSNPNLNSQNRITDIMEDQLEKHLEDLDELRITPGSDTDNYLNSVTEAKKALSVFESTVTSIEFMEALFEREEERRRRDEEGGDINVNAGSGGGGDGGRCGLLCRLFGGRKKTKIKNKDKDKERRDREEEEERNRLRGYPYGEELLAGWGRAYDGAYSSEGITINIQDPAGNREQLAIDTEEMVDQLVQEGLEDLTAQNEALALELRQATERYEEAIAEISDLQNQPTQPVGNTPAASNVPSQRELQMQLDLANAQRELAEAQTQLEEARQATITANQAAPATSPAPITSPPPASVNHQTSPQAVVAQPVVADVTAPPVTTDCTDTTPLLNTDTNQTSTEYTIGAVIKECAAANAAPTDITSGTITWFEVDFEDNDDVLQPDPTAGDITTPYTVDMNPTHIRKMVYYRYTDGSNNEHFSEPVYIRKAPTDVLAETYHGDPCDTLNEVRISLETVRVEADKVVLRPEVFICKENILNSGGNSPEEMKNWKRADNSGIEWQVVEEKLDDNGNASDPTERPVILGKLNEEQEVETRSPNRRYTVYFKIKPEDEFNGLDPDGLVSTEKTFDKEDRNDLPIDQDDMEDDETEQDDIEEDEDCTIAFDSDDQTGVYTLSVRYTKGCLKKEDGTFLSSKTLKFKWQTIDELPPDVKSKTFPGKIFNTTSNEDEEGLAFPKSEQKAYSVKLTLKKPDNTYISRIVEIPFQENGQFVQNFQPNGMFQMQVIGIGTGPGSL